MSLGKILPRHGHKPYSATLTMTLGQTLKEMNKQTTKIIKLFIRFVITTLLLVWIFNEVGLEQFWQTAKTAKLHFLLAVWIFTLLFFWIRSIALRVIFEKLGCFVSTSTIFATSAITCLYSMVLPGLLSTGVKWYILKKDTGKGSNVFAGMVYNQMSLVVVLLVFGFGALLTCDLTTVLLPSTRNQWLIPILSAILLILTITGTCFLLNKWTGPPIINVFITLTRVLPAIAADKIKSVLEQIKIFQSAGVRFHFFIAVINIISGLGIGALIYIAAAKAASVIVPFWLLIWLNAIVFVLGRLPITIANLGVREVTLVGLLAAYNVDKSTALVMSMILFSSQIFMAIIGAGYQLFWMGKQKSK